MALRTTTQPQLWSQALDVEEDPDEVVVEEVIRRQVQHFDDADAGSGLSQGSHLAQAELPNSIA